METNSIISKFLPYVPYFIKGMLGLIFVIGLIVLGIVKTIKVLKKNGDVEEITIENDYEDLGIEFSNALIDDAKSCRNKGRRHSGNSSKTSYGGGRVEDFARGRKTFLRGQNNGCR